MWWARATEQTLTGIAADRASAGTRPGLTTGATKSPTMRIGPREPAILIDPDLGRQAASSAADPPALGQPATATTMGAP
jgi:hypothetical protein